VLNICSPINRILYLYN